MGRGLRGDGGGGSSAVGFGGGAPGIGLLAGLGAMGGGLVAGLGTTAGLSGGLVFASCCCLSLCRTHAGLPSSSGGDEVPFWPAVGTATGGFDATGGGVRGPASIPIWPAVGTAAGGFEATGGGVWGTLSSVSCIA